MSSICQRERQIESHLLARCRQHGFLCLKLTSPARNGLPDRIVVTPAGTVFVEVKRPGNRLRKLQRATHAKLRRYGARIHVVDDEPSIDELMARLLDNQHDQQRAS